MANQTKDAFQTEHMAYPVSVSEQAQAVLEESMWALKAIIDYDAFLREHGNTDPIHVFAEEHHEAVEQQIAQLLMIDLLNRHPDTKVVVQFERPANWLEMGFADANKTKDATDRQRAWKAIEALDRKSNGQLTARDQLAETIF